MPLILLPTPLIESTAEAIAIPANCFGTAEPGVAAEILSKEPAVAAAYAAAARGKQLSIGRVVAARERRGRLIILVPIRERPDARVSTDTLDGGLTAMRSFIFASRLTRVALPLLGSGRLGLSAAAAQTRLEAIFGPLSAQIELHRSA